MKRILIAVMAWMFSATVFSQSIDDAKLLIYHERYNSASGILHAILSTDPNNDQAWYFLTRSYLEQNKIKEIKDSLQKVPVELINKPWLQVAYGYIFLKDNDAAKAKLYFDQALSETKQKDPTTLEEIARAYIDVKNADAGYATMLLNKALKKDKKNPEADVLLGDAYSKQENGSAAYAAYMQALQIDPHYARASYRLGKIFTSQNNPLYLKYFEDAVSSDSLYAPALYELYYYYYFRDVTKAMDYLKKYIAASDYKEDDDYLLTDMLYLNKDYNAAIDKGNELIKKEGDSVSPRIYKLIANSYKKLNNGDDALFYMTKYFSKNTDTTYLAADYTSMGEMYESFNGKEDSAAHYFILSSERTQPDTARYQLYKKIAGLFGKEKNYSSQALWLQKFYTNNPNATNVDLFNCGIAYYSAADYVHADSLFGIYTAKYPDELYGYYWRARTNAAIDTDMSKRLAIPYYSKVIEIAEKDTSNENNKKRLIESYGYIASYKANHEKDYAGSKEYFEKVLTLQPDNEDAKKYVGILEKFLSVSNSGNN
jgi:tetratricopeptide (TPR) repeat protein